MLEQAIRATTLAAVLLSAYGAGPPVRADVPQGRSTPVTVKNPVAIDQNSNGVQANQAGPWNVGVLGTPNVNVANSPMVGLDAGNNTVKAEQAGAWSVTVAGTPNVNVANSPTVKLDAANNTVKAPTQRNQFNFWTSNQTLPDGSGLGAPTTYDCSGYKEVRFVIGSDVTVNPASLIVKLYFSAPNGYLKEVGYANFDVPAQPISGNANFKGRQGVCVFTAPVMGDNCWFDIENHTGQSVQISWWSWVYMVN